MYKTVMDMTHAQNDYVAAIDLGTTKVVTLVARKDANGSIQILGFSTTDSCGIKRGEIQNVEDTIAAIKTTVNDVKAQTGIDFTSVYVGIAGQHIRSFAARRGINIENPDNEVSQADVDKMYDEMKKIALEPGEEVLHVLPMSYMIDGAECEHPVGSVGNRLECDFHIVAGKVQASRIIERCIKRCGLTVNSLVLEPLASAEAVLDNAEKQTGVALVDIGGGTTDLAIYYNGVVCHTAVIPFGGNNITNDIKVGCKVLAEQALILKEKNGYAIAENKPSDTYITIPGIAGREPREISVANLCGIIQARISEIIDLVLFQISNSGCANNISSSIVITGGGAMLRNLPQLINFKTGFDVRIGFPCQNLCSESLQKYNKPQNATAIGLIKMALNGQLPAPQYANLTNYQVDDNEIVNNISSENTDIVEEKVEELKKPMSKSFLKGIMKTFSNIFDDDDNDNM